MSDPVPGADARTLFALKREVRLWALAGAVIVSLWLSLGLARSLVEITMLFGVAAAYSSILVRLTVATDGSHLVEYAFWLRMEGADR